MWWGVKAGDRPSSADVDAVVLRDAGKPGRVALADRAELPLSAMAVELAEDHGGLGRGVLGQVVARQLAARAGVDHPDERVDDLAERLPAGSRLVDGDGEDDLVDPGGRGADVDVDDLVVALPLAGQVVPGVLDGAVR